MTSCTPVAFRRLCDFHIFPLAGKLARRLQQDMQQLELERDIFFESNDAPPGASKEGGYLSLLDSPARAALDRWFRECSVGDGIDSSKSGTGVSFSSFCRVLMKVAPRKVVLAFPPDKLFLTVIFPTQNAFTAGISSGLFKSPSVSSEIPCLSLEGLALLMAHSSIRCPVIPATIVGPSSYIVWLTGDKLAL